MTFSLPYSLSVALFMSGTMQRAAAARFKGTGFSREEHFSLFTSYACFALAAAALAASALAA